jgi:peptidoglycan endopeptidase LytE
MMKRQIFVLSLLFLFCLSLGLVSNASARQYQVKKGDTLNIISQKTGVSVRAIKQANGLKGTALKSKQVLNIPEKQVAASKTKAKGRLVAKDKPAAYYTVKKGDNLASIARKTGTPVKQIVAMNKIRHKKLRVGQKLALAKASLVPEKETVADDENVLGEDDEDAALPDDIADLKNANRASNELLGKWYSPDEQKLFVKVATGFLGAPYRLGGSTVRGIDCSAFVRKIYQLFDINLPRTAREQSNVGLSVAKNELLEGDLVFFRTRRSVGHVGIYIGNGEFVHASFRDRAVRIDNLDAPYFDNRFVRAVRVKGLDNKNGV